MLQRMITFDRAVRAEALEIFGLCEDSAGYIVEKANLKQRVLAINGDQIEAEKFAGVKKGSILLFKSDLPSLIELADRLQ